MGKVLFCGLDDNNAFNTGAAGTFYSHIAGGQTFTTPETDVQTLVRNAGTLSKLIVNLPSNGGGTTVIFRTRKNAANGNQLVTFTSGASGVLEDTSNTDTVAAGDKINHVTDASAGAAAFTGSFISNIYDATTNTSQLLVLGGSHAVATASTTWYGNLNGSLNAAQTTEASVKFRIRESETLAKLGVYVSANARTTNTIFKSRKNGADGTLTLTFGSTVTGWLEDTTHSDTLAAGDDANYAYVTSTGTQTLTLKTIKTEAVSTTSDSPLICARNTVVTQAEPLTRYYFISGSITAISTEVDVRLKVREAFTISELNILITLNGIGAASTLTLRKSGAAGNNTVSITSSGTGLFNDTTHTDVLTSTSEICYQLVTPAVSLTPTLSIAWISCSATLATSTNYDRPLTTETISVSESIARLKAANRSLSDSPAITEAIARLATNTRALSTETIIVGESLGEIFGVNRTLSTETITIGEALARLYAANRPLSAETITIGESLARLKAANRALTAETTAITESLVRTFGVVRTLSDTTVIGESLARIYNAMRTLSDTTTVSESLAKVQTLVRTLAAQTTTIGESLARILGAVRSLSDTIIIGESLARTLAAIRALATQTTTIGESLMRTLGIVRSLSDTTIISESIARLLAAIRALTAETNAISESLTKVFTPVSGVTFHRPLTAETVAVAESLVRSTTVIRTIIIETTIIAESLARLQALTRALSDTTVITGTVARVFGVVRTLSQTTVIGESLSRIFEAVRSLSQTTVIGESLARLQVLRRVLSTEITTISESLAAGKVLIKSLSDTVGISESLAKIQALIRTLSETTIVSESLSRLQTLTRTLTTQIINISDSVAAITGAFEAILIEFVSISESLVFSFLHIVKGVPLYLQPTRGIKPEGVGERNRSMERESPLYLKKQLELFVRLFTRKNSLGRFRHSNG
jgi:hypothetical protein